jgi:hypothetical protein
MLLCPAPTHELLMNVVLFLLGVPSLTHQVTPARHHCARCLMRLVSWSLFLDDLIYNLTI